MELQSQSVAASRYRPSSAATTRPSSGGDADLAAAAHAVAEGAFGFAGQRCTANWRVVVDATVYDRFVTALCDASAAIVLGDPWEEATRIGPLASEGDAERVRAVLARAQADGARLVVPHGNAPARPGCGRATFSSIDRPRTPTPKRPWVAGRPRASDRRSMGSATPPSI